MDNLHRDRETIQKMRGRVSHMTRSHDWRMCHMTAVASQGLVLLIETVQNNRFGVAIDTFPSELIW